MVYTIKQVRREFTIAIAQIDHFRAAVYQINVYITDTILKSLSLHQQFYMQKHAPIPTKESIHLNNEERVK